MQQFVDRFRYQANKARQVQSRIKQAEGLKSEIIAGESLVGGGSAPTSTLPTCVLAVTADGLSADEIALGLRRNAPPIITRVEEGRVLIDLRTVRADEEQQLAMALIGITDSNRT